MYVILIFKKSNVLQPEFQDHWIITYPIKYNGRFYAIFMFHCEPILRLPGYIIFLLQLLK